MGVVLVKLYKDLGQARAAVEALLQGGFKAEELTVVGSTSALARLEALKGASRGRVAVDGRSLEVAGPLSGQASQGELTTVLREVLGVPEDVLEYYRFGLVTGGLLLGVPGDEGRGEEARKLLRRLGGRGVEKTKSPGFDRATRMTGSDPVDAKMTGDFRRY